MPAPRPAPPIPTDTGAPAPIAPRLPATSIPSPATTVAAASTPSPRIMAQPRTSRPLTEADPLVTRVSLVRSNDGSQFGVFLQVFADGTVIDGSGVHRVGRDVLKPIVDALQDGELGRLRGHCGAPSTDFTEYVHVVVYERNFGKLRANGFSYSGNPQGCDQSVHRLHAALETLQTKISGPPTVASTPTSPPVKVAAPPVSGTAAIPLTPAN